MSVAPTGYHGSEIALVGMAGRFPGARDIEELWRNLLAGVESIRDLSDDEMEADGVAAAELRQPGYVKRAAPLDDLELFDAAFFGYTPREAELMDPQQRLFLETAWHALEHAGYDSERQRGAVGVFAGGKMGTYLLNIYSNPELVASLDNITLGLGNDIGLLAMRTSYKLGLKGPSYFVQSACSTGLVAVHLACQSLLVGECDLALAGAVAIDVPNRRGYLYQESGILSPDGHVRAFDAAARGTVFGSAVGVVVLKRLDDALAAGDRIWAVIKGSATNNDGGVKPNFTAPSVDGQAEVILRALVNAEVDPATISYVEAHGTGTQLGDPIEIRALTKAWRHYTAGNGFCALGTVKTNIGHTDAAAGICGLIKTALALDRGLLPASLHFAQPNPNVDFAATPFSVVDRLTPWPDGDGPRRAGVSSFGFGGTNAHLILEQAPAPSPSGPSRPHQLVVLSARSEAALEAASERLAGHLEAHPETPLADVAHTLLGGRRLLPWRRALVATDAADAAAVLRARPAPRLVTVCEEDRERAVGFLFPGQGAQHPGMAQQLYELEPGFRRRLDECAALLEPRLGLDLRRLLYDGGPDAAARLAATAVAQPAIFAVSYSLAGLLEELGVTPAAMLGHSLGEYVAACLAGVFGLADALALVAERGRLMAGLPPGAMLALPLGEAEALPLLGEELALAAVNGTRRTVVSGPDGAIDALAAELERQGVASRRLHTSHAFHSAMMDPALVPFRAALARLELRPPARPFLSNLSGTWIRPDEAVDPDYWVRHLRGTVRFAEGLATLVAGGTTLLLEVGPGTSLSSLAREAPEAPQTVAALRHPDDRRPDQAHLLQALGRLWAAGVPLDPGALFRGERRRRLPLPGYPFARQRFWIDPGKGLGMGGVAAGRKMRKSAEVASWFHLPSWVSALPVVAAPPEPAGRWLLFADPEGPDRGLGAALAERLAAAGQEVLTVVPGETSARLAPALFQLDPRRGDGYHELLAQLGGPPRGILHLWSLGGEGRPEEPAASLFERCQERGFLSLLHLGQALAAAETSTPVALLAATRHLWDTNGEEPLVPAKATLLGGCLVLPQEQQNVRCRVVDLGPNPVADPQGSAGRLLAEAFSLGHGAADLAVAYRGGRRLVQRYTAAPIPAAEDATGGLRPGGVYLVTGGLGSVGLLLADHLARRYGARLALLGRSALPPRDAWAAWLAAHDGSDSTARRIRAVEELEAAGAEVLPLAADVADPAALERALIEVEARFGHLDGVFHLAGTLSGDSIYRPLTEIDRAAAAAQFTPKAYGLYALAEVLANRRVDFCLLFSSNASVLGGLGFIAYAAANAFVDAFAAARSRAGGTRWISAGWDEWPVQALAAPAIQTSMSEFSMTAEEGTEAVARLLAAGPPGHVVVATGDLEARLDLWVRRDPGGMPRAGGPRHARPELGTSYVAPRDPLEERVAEIWQELLGIERVGVEDNFFDLGGHSLLATQLMTRLRGALGVDLPLQRLFEAPTVASLVGAAQEAGAALAADAAGDGGQARPGEGLIPRLGRDRAPLSFAQERMWFLHKIDPGSAAFNLLSPLRLAGPIDGGLLARVFTELVARHEILRTAFTLDEGHPVQVIAPPRPFELARLDLTATPAEERDTALLRLATAEQRRPFDLGRPPLLRVTLVRLGEADHALLLVMHHIVSDGWSMGVLLREVAELYAAFAEGRPSPLSELPIQYADFAAWQRRWLTGERLEEQVEFWRRHLGALGPGLPLATDRPRAAQAGDQPFHAGARRRELPGELAAATRALGRRRGTTLFMTLFAAFAAVMQRYTGTRELVVGVPIAGRNQADTEGLIGFFLNTLALGVRLSPRMTFRELLAQVAETSLGAFGHQDLPLETLVHRVLPEQAGRMALFQVMFLLQNFPTPPLAFSGVRLEILDPEHQVDLGAAVFDLGLTAEEVEGELVLSLTYNAALFAEPTMERFLDHYQALLAAAVADPDRTLAELPLVGAAERHELLALHPAPSPAERPATVVELFAAQAARAPQALAVTGELGDLTYGELAARAAALAGHLAGLGVGPEARVALWLERSPELIVGILGVLGAGAAYVPIDPAYPDARRDLILADAAVPVVLTSVALAPRLAGFAGRVVTLDGPQPEWAGAAPAATLTVSGPVAAESAAYLIYTSGSTGNPKGVVVEHRALAAFTAAAGEAYGITADDRVLQFASISFDTSAEEIYPALTRGATLVLRSDQVLAGAAALLGECRHFGVTVLDLPTAFWHGLIDALAVEELSVGPPIRLVILGGERVQPARLAAFRPQLAPGVRLLNTYGPTEATVVATCHDLSAPPAGGAPETAPIGRPLGPARAWVLDERLELAPRGVPGELFLGGPGVARGYLGAPRLTAERFLPDPWSVTPGGRLYRTGDQVRLGPDGSLDFLGRRDHQVKVRGFRVELGEIEAALAAHPEVREAVVVARRAAGDTRLAAYLVARGAAPGAGELRSWLERSLPEYMVPATYLVLAELPLTPSGKVDRRALPPPEDERPELATGYVAPESDGEIVLARIFADVLEVPRVGVEDNFFALGGHSLLLPQVMHRVRESFGVDVPLRALYDDPTVGALALVVEELILDQLDGPAPDGEEG